MFLVFFEVLTKENSSLSTIYSDKFIELFFVYTQNNSSLSTRRSDKFIVIIFYQNKLLILFF